MGLIDRVDQVFDPGKREFVVGEGAISRFERTYGKDPQEWSPSEYGEYIATSNSVYVCSTIYCVTLIPSGRSVVYLL